MTRSTGGYRVSVRQDLRPAPLSGTALKAYVHSALGCLRAANADIRVRVVGDAAIARWNRDFLGRPRPTNVISFPDDDAPAPGKKSVSGDIVVSAPTCLAQTHGWREAPEARVFFFVLHGMLHLAGYHHEAGGAQARRMRRKELQLYRRVLAGFGGHSRLRGTPFQCEIRFYHYGYNLSEQDMQKKYKRSGSFTAATCRKSR